mmetsp:Transcript_14911/g.2500  ORF Transcript_14911/g.2500 Transcript_14911/m.2500 type:complete len:171 (+) Transcript_14911:207-719(+)
MVILGLLEIAMSIFNIGASNFSSIIVLRAFRLLRIFKLARRWKSLRILLKKMGQSMSTIGYLGLLCFLCMFIYALIGMRLFGGKMKDEDGNHSRANFDTLFWSLITIFQIITGENWNEVMFSGVANTNWLSTLYFLSLLVIGNYVLFNLFLAILLQNFEEDEEEDDDDFL